MQEALTKTGESSMNPAPLSSVGARLKTSRGANVKTWELEEKVFSR